MSINQKDLKALQGMWDKAKPQMDCSIPDGQYEFLVVDAKFRMTQNGVPQMVCKYEVVGGNESFIGETVTQNDNLQTPDNMGWFKKKLARLGVTIPEDVEDLMQRIPGELMGKKFAGQLKSKDEFVNVYVNKFIEDVDLGDRAGAQNSGGASEEEAEQEAADENGSPKVGERVMFTSVKGGDIEGELLELTEDGKARVKTDEGKVFKVDAAKVTAVPVAEEEATEEEAEEETEDAEEEAKEPAEEATEEESSEGGFPTVEEAKAMKLPELKSVLEDNGMDIKAIKNPRLVVSGMAGFIYNEKKYLPDLPTLLALRDALGLKPMKNEKPAEVTKRVLAQLHKNFEF